jgi:hypothetical protein
MERLVPPRDAGTVRSEGRRATPSANAPAMHPAAGMRTESARARLPSSGAASAPSARPRESLSRVHAASMPLRDAAGARKSPVAAPRGLSALARLRPVAAFAAIAVASIVVASALVLRVDRFGASPVFPQAGRSPHVGAVESQAAVSPAPHKVAELPAR